MSSTFYQAWASPLDCHLVILWRNGRPGFEFKYQAVSFFQAMVRTDLTVNVGLRCCHFEDFLEFFQIVDLEFLSIH